MAAFRVPLVMALLFAVLWSVGTGAKAQPYPPPTMTIIPSLSPPPSPPPTVTPTMFQSEPPDEVPVTGADVTRFVLIAAGLTIVGTGLVRIARRRS